MIPVAYQEVLVYYCREYFRQDKHLTCTCWSYFAEFQSDSRRARDYGEMQTGATRLPGAPCAL